MWFQPYSLPCVLPYMARFFLKHFIRTCSWLLILYVRRCCFQAFTTLAY